MATATWSLIGADGTPGDDFRLDERGRLVLDHTAATPVLTSLQQHLGAWWAQPGHGSRLAALLSGTPEPDAEAAAEHAVREALAPLERAHRIKDVAVRVHVDQGWAHITVTAHDIGRGRPVTLELQAP